MSLIEKVEAVKTTHRHLYESYSNETYWSRRILNKFNVTGDRFANENAMIQRMCAKQCLENAGVDPYSDSPYVPIDDDKERRAAVKRARMEEEEELRRRISW